MSLATRCTACGTAFRVVQDQLKVSEGWVRCGRCGEVFSALEGLFDLEREDPGALHPAGLGRTTDAVLAAHPSGESGRPPEVDIGDRWDDRIEPALEAPGPLAVEALLTTHPAAGHPLREETEVPKGTSSHVEDESTLDEEIDEHLFGRRHPGRRRVQPSHVDERDRLDFSDARFDSDLLIDPDIDPADDDASFTRSAALPLESSGAAPDFMRRAESRARWKRPGVRATLAGTALVLLATLTLQYGNHFHDLAAARWPIVRPALAWWCGLAGCSVSPPRRIDDINVESTALASTLAPDVFRLAVGLRNRAAVPVSMPWIELTLTDASGHLVARKALSPAALDAAAALKPGGEATLQTLLAARDLSVTGYTVEIFYP